MQMKLSAPFCKNCWRRVVQQKLENQALCLDFLSLQGGGRLRALARQVRSGDPDNRESVGARLYFATLMPRSTRTAPTPFNIFLNYGYSIVRAALARALSAHGFLPSLGIHHKNEFNVFNLADDFLEVFRPLVDLWVMQNLKDEPFLEPRVKQGLLGLLVSVMRVDKGEETVLRALEILVGSFVGACKSKDPEQLLLPQLVPIAAKDLE